MPSYQLIKHFFFYLQENAKSLRDVSIKRKKIIESKPLFFKLTIN